jgi:hypothetical protein
MTGNRNGVGVSGLTRQIGRTRREDEKTKMIASAASSCVFSLDIPSKLAKPGILSVGGEREFFLYLLRNAPRASFS